MKKHELHLSVKTLSIFCQNFAYFLRAWYAGVASNKYRTQLKTRHKPPQKPSRKQSRTLALFPRAALPRYLTQEEVTRFFAVISSPRDRALFALIYHYDLRVEEATLFTLESVDLKNLRIRIQRLKNGVSSQKPLWRHNAKLLRSYLRVRQDAGHWIFTGRHGALKKRQIQTLFTNYAKEAGIKGRSIHSLRHSIAVHLLNRSA